MNDNQMKILKHCYVVWRTIEMQGHKVFKIKIDNNMQEWEK